MSAGLTTSPRELFLSYSSQDDGVADQIATVLRSHGVPVWCSNANLLGAQQWHDEIGKALMRCDWFAVLLSSSSLTSMWVKRELGFALDDTRYNNRIIPIVLRAGNYDSLSWTLRLFQNADFTADFHAGCRDLLRIWGLGYAQPSAV